MTLTTPSAAQPTTRRARRELERLAMAAATVAAPEAPATDAPSEPVFLTRRERRAAEAAALAQREAVDAPATKAELLGRLDAPSVATFSSGDVDAAAAPIAADVPATFAAPAVAELPTRRGAVRAERPAGLGANALRVRSIAGACAIGVAASAGVAAWLPAATQPANASDAVVDGQSAEALQALTVSGAEQAPQISRGDTATVSTMGSATAANMLTPMALQDPKAFTNDLTAAVQYPFPVGVPITDPFGMRVHPVTGETKMHEGVDLTPGEGTPIGAMAEGRVIETVADDNGGWGVYVTLEHTIDGHTVYTRYAHMLAGSISVKVGDIVHVGDTLGRVGNTGISTGPHLHFEVRVDRMDNPVDPMQYLQAHNNATTVVTAPASAVSA